MRKLTLNHLLLTLNIIFGFLAVFIALRSKFDIIVLDKWSFWFVTIFSLINIFLLLIENRIKSPLVIILTLNLSLFYIFRVFTFYFSDGYSRALYYSGDITLKDYNSALIYIIGSSFLLGLGILFGCFTRSSVKQLKIKKYYNNSSYYFIILLFLSLFLKLTYNFNVLSLQNNIVNYFLKIFPLQVMVFLSLLFLQLNKIYNYKNYKKIRYWIYLYLIIGAVSTTIVGGRRILLDIMLMTLFIRMSLEPNRIRFTYRHILLATVIFPPFLAIVYDLATFFRWQKTELLSAGGLDLFQLSKVYFEKGVLQSEGLLKQFDRAGFIDMAIETITYSHQYEKILNIGYYIKSIIDNISPGITFFDVALAGQVKQFVFNYNYYPSLSQVLEAKNYSSHGFTIFGEFFTIFSSKISFPFYFLLGYLIHSVWNFGRSLGDVFEKALVQSFLLYLFNGAILFSFGLDWAIVSIFQLLITFIFVRPILKNQFLVS